MSETVADAKGRDGSSLLKAVLVFILVLVGTYLGIQVLFGIPGFKTSRTVQDGLTVYRWSIWMSLGPVLIALLLFVLALLLRKWQAAARCIAMIGLLALVSGLTLVAVELFQPTPLQVVVGPDYFEASQRLIRFSDLKEIHPGETWSVGMRRGLPYPSHASHLRLVWNGGQSEELNVGGLLEDAVPEILERARASGVLIQVQQ